MGEKEGNIIRVRSKEDLRRVMSQCEIVNNIVKFKIMSREDTKKLEDTTRNVIVSNINGETIIITKNELVNNFTDTNGSRIKIKYLSRGKWYCAVQPCSKEVMAVYIPKNKRLDVNGKSINGGAVITMDMETGRYSVVSPKVFKKSCKITKLRTTPARRDEKSVPRSKESLLHTGMDNVVSRSELVNESSIRNVSNGVKTNTSVNNKHTLNVVAKLINVDSKLIGYVIQDEIGKKKPVPMDKVMSMVKKGMISNVELVRHPGGKLFLRGNGIRLESLQKIVK